MSFTENDLEREIGTLIVFIAIGTLLLCGPLFIVLVLLASVLPTVIVWTVVALVATCYYWLGVFADWWCCRKCCVDPTECKNERRYSSLLRCADRALDGVPIRMCCTDRQYPTTLHVIYSLFFVLVLCLPFQYMVLAPCFEKMQLEKLHHLDQQMVQTIGSTLPLFDEMMTNFTALRLNCDELPTFPSVAFTTLWIRWADKHAPEELAAFQSISNRQALAIATAENWSFWERDFNTVQYWSVPNIVRQIMSQETILLTSSAVLQFAIFSCIVLLLLFIVLKLRPRTFDSIARFSLENRLGRATILWSFFCLSSAVLIVLPMVTSLDSNDGNPWHRMQSIFMDAWKPISELLAWGGFAWLISMAVLAVIFAVNSPTAGVLTIVTAILAVVVLNLCLLTWQSISAWVHVKTHGVFA